MKFLLVCPKDVPAGKFYPFPIGIAYIAGSLKNAGYELEYLNMNHHDGPVEPLIREKLSGGDIAGVAAGGLSLHFSRIRDIFNAARTVQPGIFTAAGGGMISSEPLLMAEALGVDAGVIGEGEETMVDIARALEGKSSLSDIPGIVCKNNGKYLITGPRGPIEDLDALAFPEYDGFDAGEFFSIQRPGESYYLYVEDNPRFYPIISSRSCPFNCTFCYHPLGKKYRSRSMDSICAEIDQAIEKYDANILFFYDELFAMKKERIVEFCGRISKYNIKWSSQFRVDSVDEETLIMLRESGMYYACYGIESMSDPILKSMNKRITRAQTEATIALTRRLKIGVMGNILYGDPAETWDTAVESVDWWKNNNKSYAITINPIVPYPGSKVYEHSLQKGYIPDKLEYIESGCPAINMTEWPFEKIYSLQVMISRIVQTHTLCGVVSRVKMEGVDPKKNDAIYTVEARCPTCGEVTTYKHYYIVSYSYLSSGLAGRFCCRACNQNFWLTISEFKRASEDVPTRVSFEKTETPMYRMHTDLFLYMGNEGDAVRCWWKYAMSRKNPLIFAAILPRLRKFRKRRRNMEQKRIVHFDCRW